MTLFHVSMTLSHVAITGLSRCSMSISGLHDTVPCSYHWSVTLFHVSMTLSHVSITGLSLCSMSISGLHDTFACSYHWSVTLFHVSMTLSISGPHHAVPVTESTTLSQSQNPPRCLSHRIHHAVPVTESTTLSQSQNPPRCPSHRIQHAVSVTEFTTLSQSQNPTRCPVSLRQRWFLCDCLSSVTAAVTVVCMSGPTHCDTAKHQL